MPRRHVEHIHAPEIAAQTLDWPGWPAGAKYKPLSHDERSGACSCLLVLPDGWRRGPSVLRSDCELLVASGALRVGRDELQVGSYSFAPAGEHDDEWRAIGPTEVFLAARNGPPDVQPRDTTSQGPPMDARDVVRIPAERLAWGPTPIPNGPPNIELAMLRHNESGEMSALVRGGPRRFPVYEFHDCVEECFLLDGEIMIEPGGAMRPGTYFWRPPYLTHGQSRCESSSLLYVYTDSKLVNHFTDSLHRTPAENRAQAEAERAGGGPPQPPVRG
jgi:hypothetical protein